MNKQNIQRIIDNLKSVEQQALKEDAFNMLEGNVKSERHQCNTVHCVGGWYAIACGLHEKQKYINYSAGANLMAKHFFGESDSNSKQLKIWAYFHPLLWGNRNGYFMFFSLGAYSPNGKTKAETFSDVIAHWEEVRNRVEEYNKLSKIKNQ